jgi:hypothetical protein
MPWFIYPNPKVGGSTEFLDTDTKQNYLVPSSHALCKMKVKLVFL